MYNFYGAIYQGKIMKNEYYTAQEAIERLKMARSSFFKEVDEGLIPFELDVGRQRGRRYPKEAIDTLAERTLVKKKNKELPPLVFSPSSPADTWSEVQIGIEIYGDDDIVPYKTLLEWRDINDAIQMSMKERGQVVGYSSLMPIDERIMRPLIRDEIREREIPLDAIKQWTDHKITVYVSSLTVRPTKDKGLDSARGRFLIRETIRWALKLNQQYDIKNWYGIGATPEGQHLFEALGFQEIASVHDGERKGYYLEDIEQSAVLIKKLMDELKRERTETRAKDKVS
jgi:hypothetical protein